MVVVSGRAAEEGQMWNTRETFTALRKDGFDHIYEVVFPSNITDDLISEIETSNFFRKYRDRNIFLNRLFFAEKYPVSRGKLQVYFDGKFTLELSNNEQRFLGSYLLVSVAYPKHVHHNVARVLTDKCVGELRLHYGISIAERVFDEGIVNIAEDTTSYGGSHVALSSGDGKSQNTILRDTYLLDEASEIEVDLNPEAALLFTKALDQTSKEDIFLFLWIACEAQVGGGSGRKKLLESLGDPELLSETLHRLRDERANYVHDGKHPKIQKGDLEFLICFLRLCSLRSNEARRLYGTMLETRLRG